jgi:hypothetical protein
MTVTHEAAPLVVYAVACCGLCPASSVLSRLGRLSRHDAEPSEVVVPNRIKPLIQEPCSGAGGGPGQLKAMAEDLSRKVAALITVFGSLGAVQATLLAGLRRPWPHLALRPLPRHPLLARYMDTDLATKSA